MIVIGLTGGIGTGKSEVSDILKRLGAEVIDADCVGHEVYETGTDVYGTLVDSFGPEVVGPDGEIDRVALGAIVFGDPEALARLNALVHPRMREMILGRLRAMDGSGLDVAVVEAAILLDVGWDDLVDEIWMVEASRDAVLQRLSGRFENDEKDIKARIRAQMPQELRREAASTIIKNDGTLEELRDQVENVFKTRINRPGSAIKKDDHDR